MTEVMSTLPSVPPFQRDWWRIIGVGVVAAAAVVASFHAQAGLGELAGWHASVDLFSLRVSLSWLLPLCVDAYGATATRIAVNSARYSEHTRRHALIHAIAAIVVGVLGNAAYHLLAARVVEIGSAQWVLVVGVSIIPPVALGALAHLMALCAGDDAQAQARAVPAEVPDSGSLRIVAEASVPVRVHPAPAVPADVPGSFRVVPDRSAAAAGEPSTGAVDGPHAGGQVQLVPGVSPDQVADTGSFGVVAGRSAADEVHPAPAVPADVPEPVELHLKAIETYAPLVAKGEVPAIRTIKRELGCGQPNAQRVRAYLSEYVTA